MRIWTYEEDDYLRRHYALSSRQQLADGLKRSLPAIRARLMRLRLASKVFPWSEEELASLRKSYRGAVYREDVKLDLMAKKLGRHKSNICRKARSLGLTDHARFGMAPENRKKRRKYATDEELRAATSKRAKEMWSIRPHPRGMAGKKHTQETKDKIGLKSIAQGARLTKEQKRAIAIKALKTKAERGIPVTLMQSVKVTWKAGWREVNGRRIFFRSKWEANYGYYLEWLKQNGQIREWLHEPKTFWFDKIKRGCVSYLPDFLVVENNGAEAYHEVKGWMDDRSKTKLARMRKYYPEVKLIVIDAKAYRAIQKKCLGLVPGWEKSKC